MKSQPPSGPEFDRIRPPAFPPGCLDGVLTPALIAFRARIEHNIAVMKAQIAEFAILRPHVKTHKSGWVLRRLIDEGLTKAKAATPREVELCLDAGLKDVLLAHAPVGAKARELAGLAQRFADARLSTIVEERSALEHMAAAAREMGVTVGVRIDLDVGMCRTGVSDPSLAVSLARMAAGLEGVRFAGLHVYDGHIRGTAAERRRDFEALMEKVVDVRRAIEASGVACPEVTLSGSGTFQFAAHHAGVTEASPGTWIYWDLGYTQRFADLDFRPAVYVLGRVVSASRAGQITIDAGNKAISTDQPAEAGVMVHPVAGALGPMSEEHTVVHLADDDAPPPVGAVTLVCPRHVCSTVHLFDEMTLVGPDAAVQTLPIDGRTRRLRGA